MSKLARGVHIHIHIRSAICRASCVSIASVADHLTGSRGSTTAATEATTELRSVVAWSTTFLALTGIATAITALTVTSGTTTATATAFTVFTTHHATRRSVRALLLDVSCRNNLSWQMEPLAQVVESLWG